MSKQILALGFVSLFFSDAYALELLKQIQRGIENLQKTPAKQENLQQKQEIQPTDISCISMLNASPKNTLANKTAENMLKGAITGAALGAILGNDRGKGAIIGAITGAMAATAYTAATTKYLQPEKPQDTAKKLNYSPSMGELLALEVIPSEKKSYKVGSYAEVVLRVSLLTPESLEKKEQDPIPVWVTSYLVKDNTTLYPLASESYYLYPGTYGLPYYFPICNEIRPGNYKLRFQVTSLGKEASKDAEFEVSVR